MRRQDVVEIERRAADATERTADAAEKTAEFTGDLAVSHQKTVRIAKWALGVAIGSLAVSIAAMIVALVYGLTP